ncbi:MAG: DeoR family transcriptional regulator, partial [Marmoricola sp.]
MLAAQRKDLILATLRAEGRVVAKELAAELELSEDTIRRDLREL